MKIEKILIDLFPLTFKEFCFIFSQPYSDCIEKVNEFDEFSSDMAKRTFRRFNKYTFENCILVCLNDDKPAKCGSIDLTNLTKSETPLDQRICIETYLRSAYFNNQYSTCREKCPLECNTVNYIASSSSAAYPPESYKRLMDIYFNTSLSFKPTNSRFLNIKNIEERILSVNIFYKVTDLNNFESKNRFSK